MVSLLAIKIGGEHARSRFPATIQNGGQMLLRRRMHSWFADCVAPHLLYVNVIGIFIFHYQWIISLCGSLKITRIASIST